MAIAFGATTVAYGDFAETLRRRSVDALAISIAAPALLATLLPVSPTGAALWDTALLAVFVAGVACLASLADRRAVLAAAVLAALASVLGDAGVLAGAAALGVAAGNAALGARLPASKALAGGLAALALLDLRWPSGSAPRLALAVATIAIVSSSAVGRASRLGRRRSALAAGGLLALATVACGAAGLQAQQARADLEVAVEDARAGLSFARAGEVDAAAAKLRQAKDGFARAERRLSSWAAVPVKLVPGAAQNQRAVATIARTGASLAAASVELSTGFDLHRLRLRGGRMDLDAVVDVRRELSDVAEIIDASAGSLEAVRSSALLPQVDDALARFTDELVDARRSTRTSLTVLRLLPDLLGGSGVRRYFLGVQAVSESRATGGIIGSHGVLTVDDGRLTLGELGHTSGLNLVDGVLRRSISGPPDFLRRYSRYEPARTWQNVTMSPDGPSVGEVVTELYPQSGGRQVDGVILIDHVALAALLRLTGPVKVDRWPDPLTADNLGTILLHEQYVRFPTPDRVDFLADAARGVFDRITGSELPPPNEVTAALAPAAAGRHIVLYSTRPEEERLFADLHLDGSFPPVSQDFIGLVTQNASGNKIDWYLHRALDYRATVTTSGDTDAQVTVQLDNTAPSAGVSDLVIAGSGLNPTARGVNRMVVAIYSPLELTSATIDGRVVHMRAERELGRNVYETFVSIDPGSIATIELHLRGRLPITRRYTLDVWAQPMVTPDVVDVNVDLPGTSSVDERFRPEADRRLSVRSR